VVPCREIGLQILQHSVVGIERLPAVRHLHDIGRVAGRDHGRELFEGLAPRKGGDLDMHAGIGVLEGLDDLLQRLRPLGAGDDLDKAQGRVGAGGAGDEQRGQAREKI
jgi:hypothetical protein